MEERFRVLLEQGIKTLEEIEEDIEREKSEKEKDKNIIIEKVNQLCLKLTEDYYRDNIKLCKRLITNNIDINLNKKKISNLSNSEDQLYVVDTGRKYHKIIMKIGKTEDVHCFVDIFTGKVYNPQSDTSPNKKRVYDLDKCILVADWRGYYLKDVPDD